MWAECLGRYGMLRWVRVRWSGAWAHVCGPQVWVSFLVPQHLRTRVQPHALYTTTFPSPIIRWLHGRPAGDSRSAAPEGPPLPVRRTCTRAAALPPCFASAGLVEGMGSRSAAAGIHSTVALVIKRSHPSPTHVPTPHAFNTMPPAPSPTNTMPSAPNSWDRPPQRRFSNSIAPPVVGASLEVFDMLSASTDLRDRLEENAAHFRARMTQVRRRSLCRCGGGVFAFALALR